jgi:hypothetical protein
VTFPIALEEMEAAYTATGLVPADGCFLDVELGRACPLGAVYVRLKDKDALARLVVRDVVVGILNTALGLTAPQAADFIIGFDNDDPEGVEDFDAYAAGQVARARFLPPRPPEA